MTWQAACCDAGVPVVDIRASSGLYNDTSNPCCGQPAQVGWKDPSQVWMCFNPSVAGGCKLAIEMKFVWWRIAFM
jgi:hypothetical protein